MFQKKIFHCFQFKNKEFLIIYPISSYCVYKKHIYLKMSMWVYNLTVNNIVRSKYIFVENNKIEILFSNYIFELIFQSPSSKSLKMDFGK